MPNITCNHNQKGSFENTSFHGNFPWTMSFPEDEKVSAIQRWMTAQQKYFDYMEQKTSEGAPTYTVKPGYRSKLRELAGKHTGKRCFVLGNGPSLKDMDINPLRNEITIGSNGVYRMFDEWGFCTTYFTMEDVAQVEDRRYELSSIQGPTRIFGVDNAYCVEERDDTLFANVIRYSHPSDSWWKNFYPGFSIDFSSCVYLGSTVSYLNLQLAFYLGCNPIYVIGIDHDYGPLQKMFPPGKIEITPEVLSLLEKVHCIKGYHKVGGRIGIPYVAEQEKAFQKALDVYQDFGKQIFNAGFNSKLDIFPRANFSELF